MFFDVLGTRARRIRQLGVVVGAAALAYVVMLVVGLFGPAGSPFGFGLFGSDRAPSAVSTRGVGAPVAASIVTGMERADRGWGATVPAFGPAAGAAGTASATSRVDRRPSAGVNQIHTPPGQTQTPLGQAETPPGQAQTSPGQSASAPGHAREHTNNGDGNGNGHGNGHHGRGGFSPRS